MHRLLGIGSLRTAHLGIAYRALVTSALALAAVCALAGPALGQTAQELSAQGASALQAGRYADAVKAFDAAYRLQPAPVLLYNLGLAYKGMGFPGKALQALESYVTYADAKTEAAAIASARGEVNALKAAYARFALKLQPEGATIDIDGKRVAPENNEVWVATGKHTLSIRASGYESYEQTLDVVAGRFDLEVQLRQETMPPAERAVLLIDEGVALEAAGDLAGALGKYQQAEALQSSPRGLGQRGLVEQKLGSLPEAEMHLKASLALRTDKWVRANRAKMNKALRDITKQLADLEIKGAPEAEGAEVTVNERPVGSLPIVGSVRAVVGSVIVQARKPGYALFEQIVELPRRSKRTVMISLEEAPAPVVVPVPVPAPAPEPAPVASQPAEPAPVEPIAIEPIKTDEPSKVAQADIESFSDPRKDLEDDPDGPREDATGFEAALNFGYHPGISGPKLEGSSGTLTGQILLGARIIWPLSFGVAINGGFDLGNDGTKFLIAGHPGLYVRGHLQRYKRAMSFDVWAGTGVQPLSLQVAAVETDQGEINPALADPSEVSADGVARLLATRELGFNRFHTVQTLNIPAELGATFYITPAFGVSLALGLTFWVPMQDCVHDSNDARFCKSDGLDTKTSFFIGGGLAFLP